MVTYIEIYWTDTEIRKQFHKHQLLLLFIKLILSYFFS